MLLLLLLIGLVWLPLLFFGVERRGFSVLLAWLIFAPILGYLAEHAGGGSGTARDIRVLLSPNHLVLAAFGAHFLLRAVIMRQKGLLAFDKTEKWMGVFTLFLISSLLFQSTTLGYSARVVLDGFILPFLTYFVAKRLITNEQRLRKLIQVLGYTGAYLILTAFTQGALGKVERLSGLFGHRDALYVVLVVVFFVVLSNFLARRSGPEDGRVFPDGFSFFIIASIPIVILLMWTRGDWLGFGFGLWVFFALSAQLLNFKRRLVFVAFFAMLIPVVFVGWQEFATDFTVERVSNQRNVFARLAAWQSVFNSVLDSPVLGNGLGNTEDLLSSQRSLFEGVKNLTSPHNSFLALLGDLGAIGLLAYLAVVASLFKMGLFLRRRGSQHRDRWRGITVISIMAAHLAAAFFNNVLFSPVISHVYVFAYLGAIAGVYSRVREHEYGYIRNRQVSRTAWVHENRMAETLKKVGSLYNVRSFR